MCELHDTLEIDTDMRNRICQNYIILQLKLKKQLIYNYCATIP
jgi:hypothetical protein